MIKSYKIRLFPTKEQEQKILQHIGACRYIWNWMLTKQKEVYELEHKHLSAYDMINLLKPLKNDGCHDWLYQISNASCQKICRDLEKAYREFFHKTSRFPRYKTKKNKKASFPTRETIWFDENFVQIEKIGKVKYKTDFSFPRGTGHKFLNPRVSYNDDKWMLSFGIEFENQKPILKDALMGIDLGIKELAIVAYDDEKLIFHNINKSKKLRQINKQIIRIQRSISRKYEANRIGNRYTKTKNVEREEHKLRKMYAKISNIRNNYIHQTTHQLVSLLPKRIVMEDLSVINMMKNHHLAKAIQEQCFYEFIRQMKYKCEWNGIEFAQVNKFYPSSKTCHNCGSIKSDLKLNDRIFVCKECGYLEDRDYNAALNLRDAIV